MKARRASLLTAVTAAAAAVLAALPATPSSAAPDAITAGTGPDLSQYTVRFQDDFNSLDTSTWNFRTDAKAHSCQKADNVSVSNSTLVIDLKKESATCAGQTWNWTGGGVVSKQKYRYGYYEARAKMPSGPGWHSAFWSMCGDGSTTSPACRQTEIDGYEVESASPTKIRHNMFDWSKGYFETTISPYDPGVEDPADLSGYNSTDWHTYGYLYDETGVTFYIDGVKVPVDDGTLKWTASAHPGDWMNIWLTSIVFNNPTAQNAPGQFLVDWTKFWEKDRYIDNDGADPGDTYTESGGGWATSGTAKNGFAQSSSRYSCTAGSTARWTTPGLAAGKYKVSIYNVSDSNSDSAAKVAFTHDGQASNYTLDQKNTASGWHQLGDEVTLGSGQQSVSITASGTGCARADSVKFERVG
ncbi:family 16 glycosylhydrolase [Streptomyces sp. NPDC093223]|uniref:family 16 glycosylhydrolase n=1 Tax=Streptomyces sp. NPDC093223 TaxID=3366033 RepID=UPI003804A383